MITPAAATPAGAPATPFNMAIPVAAVGQGVHGAQANVDQDITGEAGGDARADGLPADSAAEMQSPNGVGLGWMLGGVFTRYSITMHPCQGRVHLA